MWAVILAAMFGSAGASLATPRYVGGAACGACHTEEHRRWSGSQHDLAMQEANADTVLGNFADAALMRAGAVTRFRTRDGKYFIHAEGPDGVARDHRVRYTFGVAPLQQYLLALPGGRLQAYDAAWDSRPESEGGQRWFPLRPDARSRPGDVLHWAGPAQNWNQQCADCHSTNVRKNYDPKTAQYHTAWSDIDVACEACHGPGSEHVAWAASAPESQAAAASKGFAVALEGSEPDAWMMDPDRGIARRRRPRTSRGDIDTCAPCHSRRSPIDAPMRPGRPFLDGYEPVLLEAGLYHPDGQIDDEVYVYGSFVQSKMFRAGVGCVDCHDPHGLAIREPADGVCAKCHLPSKFATPTHHHHGATSAGASCVACHMPAKRYMVIDARHDHGFRVPRPDLSVELGTPNACTACHADEDARWAADAVVGWYGTRAVERSTFARALRAGAETSASGVRLLTDLARDRSQPGIARASAFPLLGRYETPAVPAAIVRGLTDEDALVRMAAAEAASTLGRDAPRDALFPLLADRYRAVRIEAARSLAPFVRDDLAPARREPLERALAEYRHAQTINADRPEAHVNLGSLQASLGDVEAAERSYRTAIDVGSHFIPAYLNLADLLRAKGRDAEGETLLERALQLDPDSRAAHLALGLLLVRTGRRDAALDHLRTAAAGEPDDPHFAYVYALALHARGDTAEALAVLREDLSRHDGHQDTILALATLCRDSGARDQAIHYAKRLLALDPLDARGRGLVRELRSR